jgi:hypothetical protein
MASWPISALTLKYISQAQKHLLAELGANRQLADSLQLEMAPSKVKTYIIEF